MATTGPDQVHFNGIDLDTGHHLFEPISMKLAAEGALHDSTDARHLAELKARHAAAAEETYAPLPDVDPSVIAEAGWGVLVAQDADPGVRDALAPLLDLRRSQAQREDGERRYWEFAGEDGYHPGDRKIDFLDRHRIPLGRVDPDRAPYYLLIVGSPEEIPFRFQFEMDVQYAVGRLHFDTPDEYRRYAESVVEAETRGPPRPRKLALFGTAHAGDRATELSREYLMEPLAHALAKLRPGRPKWEILPFIGDAATKDQLGRLLGGPETPPLLFTASHGAWLDPGNAEHRRLNGALLCQDWSVRSKPEATDYFAASDVAAGADLRGAILFHFACFGAGTPRENQYTFSPPVNRGHPSSLASESFIARLPQAVLSHSNGGALAVVGHVERALGHSFCWPTYEGGQFTGWAPTVAEYRAALRQLMDGAPIGFALEGFGQRYADLATALEEERVAVEEKGKRPLDKKLVSLWAGKNDARAFVVLGDPAVRLNVAG